MKSSGGKPLHPSWHTLSRSYGVNLPSSLTRVLSSALGFSPHLRVSVYGTVTKLTRYEDFLGSMGLLTSVPKNLVLASQCLNNPPDLPRGSTYELDPGRPSPGKATLLRLSFADNASSVVGEYSLLCHRLRLSASP